MRLKYLAVITLLALAFIGCNTMMLTPVNYAWPLETSLKMDETGVISENRYAISINVQNMIVEETAVPFKASNEEIHLIRNQKGFYFLTANGFKNVYVFASAEGSLKLVKKVLVAQDGLKSPAFNQREPNIELLQKGIDPIVLTEEGVLGGKNEK